MASHENTFQTPDSAELSAPNFDFFDNETLDQMLKQMLEEPEPAELTIDPSLMEPGSLAEYGFADQFNDFDWTNQLEFGQASGYVENEQQSPAAPLVLEPQPTLAPPPSTLPQRSPPTAQQVTNTKAPNKRSENISSINPANFYQSAPYKPVSWPEYQETFKYNSFGELIPQVRYTPAQINEYITQHALNYADGHTYNGKTSGLTLWIQTTPADSSRRYPSPASNTCRFADCPVLNKSITKGTFRVAFDEWSSGGYNPPVDPYHCAGYVHLYCLERFAPFSWICANFNVRADTRILPEGKNKMAITRDHQVQARLVEKYINIVSKPEFDHNREYDYKKTLCHKLVKTHLELEPRVRQRVREERGGNSLDKHLGDLSVYAAVELEKKKAREARNPPKTAKTTARKPKRKRDEDESPDMDDMFAEPSPKRSRT